MLLMTTDIAVPVLIHQREHCGVDYRCGLCEEAVGTDHNFQPKPHLLNECLVRMKERITKLEGVTNDKPDG